MLKEYGIIRKIACLVLIMFCCMLCVDVAHAAPSSKKVKKAYMKQVKKVYNKGNKRHTMYKMHDFNKDGVKELVVAQAAGARGNYYVYTYRKGKVVKLNKKTYNEIGRLKGTKYIVGLLSGGSAGNVYEVFAIKGKKLKLVARYISEYNYDTDEVHRYKNDQFITLEKYNKFVNRIQYFDMKEY